VEEEEEIGVAGEEVIDWCVVYLPSGWMLRWGFVFRFGRAAKFRASRLETG
jgi:hypothetical protein